MDIKILKGYHNFKEAQGKCPNGYHLPSKEEVQKMLDETTYHFDQETKEGVFTYPDGQEIRLPANGWKGFDDKTYNKGKVSRYWSSSAYSGTHAWCLHFYSFNARLDYGYRGHGFPVFCIANQ